MKTHFSPAHLGILALSLAIPAGAQAALLVYEGFDYAVGANAINASANGGIGFGGAWDAPANSGDVIAGSMSYTDGGGRSLTTSGNTYFGDSTTLGAGTVGATSIANFRNMDATINAAALGGATTLYVSVMMQQTTGAGRATNFAIFTNVANNGIYTSQERISFGHGTETPSAGLNPYTWGAFVFGNGNNGALPQVIGSNYSTVSMYNSTFAVLRIDINASGLDERFRLYLNPSLDAEPGVAQVDFLRDSLVSLNEIDRIRPFAGGSTATLGAAQTNLDEIRMGTAWGDVTPFTPVPEPSAALLSLACVGLALVRRRR